MSNISKNSSSHIIAGKCQSVKYLQKLTLLLLKARRHRMHSKAHFLSELLKRKIRIILVYEKGPDGWKYFYILQTTVNLNSYNSQQYVRTHNLKLTIWTHFMSRVSNKCNYKFDLLFINLNFILIYFSNFISFNLYNYGTN